VARFARRTEQDSGILACHKVRAGSRTSRLPTLPRSKSLLQEAIATVLDKIGSDFERETGHKLNVISGFGPVFVRQINAEPFDVFVSLPVTMEGSSKTAS
jgi:hypothetical protein